MLRHLQGVVDRNGAGSRYGLAAIKQIEKVQSIIEKESGDEKLKERCETNPLLVEEVDLNAFKMLDLYQQK